MQRQRRAKIGTNLGEAFLKAYALKQFPHGVQEVQPIKAKKEKPKIVLSEYDSGRHDEAEVRS